MKSTNNKLYYSVFKIYFSFLLNFNSMQWMRLLISNHVQHAQGVSHGFCVKFEKAV